MKKITIAFILLLWSSTIYCQITSPNVFIKDFRFSNDRIEVDYGFENCSANDKYLVWIEATTEKGKVLKAKSYGGDFTSVAPISDHKLLWLINRDSVNIDDKISIKLFALKHTEINMGKAWLCSTLLPGAGHKQAG